MRKKTKKSARKDAVDEAAELVKQTMQQHPLAVRITVTAKGIGSQGGMMDIYRYKKNDTCRCLYIWRFKYLCKQYLYFDGKLKEQVLFFN